MTLGLAATTLLKLLNFSTSELLIFSTFPDSPRKPSFDRKGFLRSSNFKPQTFHFSLFIFPFSFFPFHYQYTSLRSTEKVYFELLLLSGSLNLEHSNLESLIFIQVTTLSISF
jgi:hypothetical protein